jgi:hypothetical protein
METLRKRRYISVQAIGEFVDVIGGTIENRLSVPADLWDWIC